MVDSQAHGSLLIGAGAAGPLGQAAPLATWRNALRTTATTLLRGAVLAVVLLVLWCTGCEDPTGAVTGVTAVSSVSDGHFHRATIPISDIEAPPENGRNYTSTTAADHVHTVKLTTQQLTALQEPNSLVSVTCEPAKSPGGVDHDHVFTFQR